MPTPQFWATIGNTIGVGARDYAHTANADKDLADGMAAVATYISSIAGNRPGTMTAEKHESVSSSLDQLVDDRHFVTELADDMTPFFSSGMSHILRLGATPDERAHCGFIVNEPQELPLGKMSRQKNECSQDRNGLCCKDLGLARE